MHATGSRLCACATASLRFCVLELPCQPAMKAWFCEINKPAKWFV